MGPVIFCLPLISLINVNDQPYDSLDVVAKLFLWVCLIVVNSIKAILQLCAYTSIILLVNDSAHVSNLGLVNGVSQASASLARGIGPALAGVLWAWTRSPWNTSIGFPMDYHLVFIIFMLIYIIDSIACAYIPKYFSQSSSNLLEQNNLNSDL